MATREQIHAFATRWQAIFSSGQLAAGGDYAAVLGRDLDALGFVMDSFGSVVTSDQPLPPLTDHVATRARLQAITAVQPLGNAMYSMWRQITHWNIDDYLAAPDNQFWFNVACQRLAALTQPLGAIEKILLTSDESGYLQPEPDPGQLAGQTLTLALAGQASLSNRFVSGYEQHQVAAFDAKKLQRLLPALMQVADPAQPQALIPDVGSWTLTVIGQGGQQQATGPLIGADDAGLSERLRDLLPFPQLLLFDDAPDQLQRLVAYYRPDAHHEEKLVLDRRSQTLSLTQRHDGSRVRLAIADPSIGELLNELAVAPTTQELPPASQPTLTVTTRFRYGTPVTMQGTLSLDAPIPGWDDCAEWLRDWLKTHAPAMLDARLLTRKTPRPGDLLYAQVVFHHGGTAYSYLADPKYAVGDRVVVFAGYGQSYGTIVSMAYYVPSEAPYPPSRTKAILALADPLEEAKGE
ncbi:MAG: hypothetical protein LKJ69_08390 [Lactobacillus sp.]|jgi:hypothetical protein|nr:hypothetical protein [Lactobacillus sp.]MCI2033409.1 hypothetical protein [Lactobacillus sp.]